MSLFVSTCVIGNDIFYSLISIVGIDAFSNIQKRLDEVLSKPPDPKSIDPVQPPVLKPPSQAPVKAPPAAKPKTSAIKKPQGILKKH